MPDTEPRKLRSVFLTRLKHGSNGRPFSDAHTAWPRTCSVLPGSRTWRIGPAPANCMDAGGATVIENPACATGAIEAGECEHLARHEPAGFIGIHRLRPKPAQPLRRRKRSPIQNAQACLTPTYWAGVHDLYPLLTIPTVATLEQVGW